eukprot:scaffold13344_cov64-Phaeocystis_antarctica.AAC.3
MASCRAVLLYGVVAIASILLPLTRLRRLRRLHRCRRACCRRRCHPPRRLGFRPRCFDLVPRVPCHVLPRVVLRVVF